MLRLTQALRDGAIAVALAVPLCASATDYQLSFGGVFDFVLDDTPSNVLKPLLGTPFSFSVLASDVPARADFHGIEDDGTSAWCFCSAPYVASASTAAFSFTGGQPITMYASNDRSTTTETVVPPGTYDTVEWDGWLQKNPDGALIGDPGSSPGINYNFTLVLVGESDWLDGPDVLPGATFDLSRIVYGAISLVEYIDGVEVGGVAVDPLLHVEDGRLVGDGMSVSISSVPEPASGFLYLGGLALWAASRFGDRRQGAATRVS